MLLERRHVCGHVGDLLVRQRQRRHARIFVDALGMADHVGDLPGLESRTGESWSHRAVLSAFAAAKTCDPALAFPAATVWLGNLASGMGSFEPPLDSFASSAGAALAAVVAADSSDEFDVPWLLFEQAETVNDSATITASRAVNLFTRQRSFVLVGWTRPRYPLCDVTPARGSRTNARPAAPNTTNNATNANTTR